MYELIEKAECQVTQRTKIHALQDAIKQMPQIQEELVHHFTDGLYGREMRVPAGTILVGKTHKKPCFNIILEGEVEVRAPEGAFRVKAPEFFISPAGTKRAMAVISDLTWITVHPSNETDLDKLELELIEAEE